MNPGSFNFKSMRGRLLGSIAGEAGRTQISAPTFGVVRREAAKWPALRGIRDLARGRVGGRVRDRIRSGISGGARPLAARPLAWLRTLAGHWRLIAAALVAGAIVHILVTLSAAQFSEAASYRTLTRGLPVNTVAFAGPVAADQQALPFFAPDVLYSYCHYDASTARIRVSARLPDAGWSLSLHTRKGENFYYVPGTQRQLTTIELVLEPPVSVFSHGDIEVTAANQSIPTVKLPDVHGLIILRAPIKGLAYREQVDKLRAAFSCQAQDDRFKR